MMKSKDIKKWLDKNEKRISLLESQQRDVVLEADRIYRVTLNLVLKRLKKGKNKNGFPISNLIDTINWIEEELKKKGEVSK